MFEFHFLRERKNLSPVLFWRKAYIYLGSASDGLSFLIVAFFIIEEFESEVKKKNKTQFGKIKKLEKIKISGIKDAIEKIKLGIRFFNLN
jgi:hypothetical protein